MTPRFRNGSNFRRLGRAALGLLRPLRGPGFALGQHDRFAKAKTYKCKDSHQVRCHGQ
ncbi:MAG: hypothetical protein IJ658_02675 [Kiritimatiellae bacterium]|nr:hypothetical protein [Kiritimatiellia bacterium]